MLSRFVLPFTLFFASNAFAAVATPTSTVAAEAPLAPASSPVDPNVELVKKCKAAISEVGEKAGGSTLSREMIELELSGYRWAGAPEEIRCLKKATFNYVRPIHVKYSDTQMLDPKYLLKKNREVKITKEKWIDDGSVEVEFVYIGTRAGKDVAVNDRLVYTINFGDRRKARGCASFLTEPEHFVMREACHQE